jgi:hypothetical protein
MPAQRHDHGRLFRSDGRDGQGRIPFDAKEFAKHAERIEFLAPQTLENFARVPRAPKPTPGPEIWTN